MPVPFKQFLSALLPPECAQAEEWNTFHITLHWHFQPLMHHQNAPYYQQQLPHLLLRLGLQDCGQGPEPGFGAMLAPAMHASQSCLVTCQEAQFTLLLG